MAGRKKSVSVQEELLLCPSAKPGDWFPGIPVSAVAGIDEAGRGCLAGPVVAAAVILPEGAVIPGLADSKVLSPTRRDGLAAEIGAVALAWGLGVVWPPEIDSINILRTATRWSRSFRRRPSSPKHSVTCSWISSTTAIPAMVLPSTRATAPKSILPPCASLGRAPCTGRRSGAFCPNSRRRGRARFCDLAAGKGARRRGCRRGLAEKGRDADTRPQLAQRFV